MPALILLGYLSLLALSLLDNLRGPLFPDILRDLHVSGATGSAFFAVTSLASCLSSWTSHRLVAWKSPMWVLRVASVWLAVGFVGITIPHDFAWTLVACTFFGWAFGALNLVQNLLILENSPGHWRRRLMNGLHGMYGFASLLAPAVAMVARDSGLSWRQTFALAALVPIGLVVGSFYVPSPRLRPSRQSEVAPAVHLHGRRDWLVVVLVALMMSCYLWGEISVTTRLVQWLQSDRNFGSDRADVYLMGFFATLVSGRLLFSVWRVPGVTTIQLLWLSAVSSAAALVLGLHSNPLWLVFSGFTMAPFYPLVMEHVAQLFGPRTPHALGLVIGTGSLSVVVMHVAIGSLGDVWGLSRALLVGPLGLGLASLGLSVVVLRGFWPRTIARTQL